MKTIVIGSALFNWGETHRMVSIGLELQKRGYHIVFLGEGTYDSLLNNTGFTRAKIPEDREWFTEERIRKMMEMDTYVNDYTSFEELKKQIQAEVEVMKKYNPVMVITGYRTTLSISARVIQAPLVWVMSSAISEKFFAKQVSSLPENSILNRYFEKDKMKKNKDIMLEFVKKMVVIYNETSRVWNKVNEFYGLPVFKSDLDIFKGDLNIVSDPLEFGEDERGYKYCGPIFLRNKIELPEIVDRIDKSNRKKIFIILGSSGRKENFFSVMDAVRNLDYEFYVACNYTMSQDDKKKYPTNFHFGEIFPVYEKAKKVDACITNGGQGTIYAVLAAGKPFVGIALFMEQQYNLETLTSRNYGIQLQKEEVDMQSMKNALEKVLYDETIQSAAKEGGKIVEKYLMDPAFAAEKKAADLIEEYLNEKKD